MAQNSPQGTAQPAASGLTQAQIAALSFEEAIKALDEVVRKLEAGQVPLEEAIAAYEAGMQLKAHCAEKLRLAEAKIEKIRLDSEGNPTGTTPLDAE